MASTYRFMRNVFLLLFVMVMFCIQLFISCCSDPSSITHIPGQSSVSHNIFRNCFENKTVLVLQCQFRLVLFEQIMLICELVKKKKKSTIFHTREHSLMFSELPRVESSNQRERDLWRILTATINAKEDLATSQCNPLKKLNEVCMQS